MEPVTRRRFLGQALIAGAGTTLFRGFAPSDYAEADLSPESDTDPGFVAGRIVDSQGQPGIWNRLLTLEDLDGKIRSARVAMQSSVWKMGRWNAQLPAPGECVFARGELDVNEILEIDRAWIDIKNYKGTVRSASPSEVLMTLSDGNEISVRIIDLTEVETHDGGTVNGSADGLGSGDLIQVVGFGDPISGTFTGTRILLAISGPTIGDPTADDFFDPPAPTSRVNIAGLPQCTYTYKGLTTWFCCGNVGGCGGCSGVSSGNGKCGDCRSDKLHMAWPHVITGNDCDVTDCSGDCPSCCSSQPGLECGKSVSLYNPCTSMSTSVTVHDCGPCVHCHAKEGCKDRTKVKFDLTPCAFTKIKNNLDAGIASLNATVTLPC